MLIDFDAFPRYALCHRPTPIEPMERLSQLLGGPKLYIKRDDCTGLAMGGNKTRKLEFLLGEALKENADMLVTQGAVQSNHVRQTAAAACRLGLTCHALLERRVTQAEDNYETSGNVLLDKLLGASYEFYPAGLDMNEAAKAVTQKFRQQGHRPYFIPGGGSNSTGALGYADCAQEIMLQSQQMAQQMGMGFDYMVMGTGSTGTQAGLVAGFGALEYDLPVIGISVRQPKAKQIESVKKLALETLARLTKASTSLPDIWVEDEYVGEGYGVPAPSTMEAIELAAKNEGILLDPVYSAKAMAGLIGMVRAGFFKPSDHVLFLHTGGAAALFAYADKLNRHLQQGI